MKTKIEAAANVIVILALNYRKFAYSALACFDGDVGVCVLPQCEEILKGQSVG